jgi:hypothetical protein
MLSCYDIQILLTTALPSRQNDEVDVLELSDCLNLWVNYRAFHRQTDICRKNQGNTATIS